MKKIIIFDIGNTNIKMYLFNQSNKEEINLELIIGSSQLLLKKRSLALLKSLKKNLGIWQNQDTLIYIGSPSEIFATKLKQILENDLKITNIKIINHNYPFDVKTVIQKEKIGLDIIASASYANSLTNDSFVFMFGSASVAIQILNKTISGVSIAPGIGFSFYKLQKHLKKSSSGNATWNYPVTFSAQMGTNTLKALNSGLYKMFLGYIVSHLVLQNKVIKDIFITGGDVNLKAHLQKELRLIFPHLKVHIVNSMVALGFAQVINKK